ncbi:MAG: hypothetical protein AAF654_11455 [Myxococcota bacterium]
MNHGPNSSQSDTPARVLALVDQPNLSLLLGPVLQALMNRGVFCEALVVDAGKPGVLTSLGIPVVTDTKRALMTLLTHAGPRLFVNGADMIPQHKLGIQLDELCRSRGVPSLTLEHAPFAIDYDGEFPEHVAFAADRMAVIGNADKEQYLALGVAEERLVVTGCPQYDALHALGSATTPATRADEIVLFGRSHSYVGVKSRHGIEASQWRQVYADLYDVLLSRYPESTLVVKPHPAEPYLDTDRLYLDAAASGPHAARVRVVSTSAKNEELIGRAAGVISFSPSVFLETRILGKACIGFDHLGRTGPLLADIEESGGTWLSCDPLETAPALARALDAGLSWPESPGPLSDAFVQKYLHRLDGKSTDRIANLAIQMLNEGPNSVVSEVTPWPTVHPHAARIAARGEQTP